MWIPLTLLATLEEDDSYGSWSMYGICLLYRTISNWLSSMTIYAALFISVDVYVAISYPLEYAMIITQKISFILCIFAWIISIIIVSVLFQFEQTKGTGSVTVQTTNAAYCLFLSATTGSILKICIYF